jgi:hypothetical protein
MELLAESRGPLIEKDVECDVKNRHLQVCSHSLCRLRTAKLTPVSKY